MKHIEYIKTSQTWTCPATGKWKIIAVGGGASGGGNTGNTNGAKNPVAGGTTSFGTYISAAGGAAPTYTRGSTFFTCTATSGYGGFTGFTYGESPLMVVDSDSTPIVGDARAGVPGQTGFGYGAGGGVTPDGSGPDTRPGFAGALECTIIDLTQGEDVVCTIGKGGATPLEKCIASGADGVIVVQYLGA